MEFFLTTPSIMEIIFYIHIGQKQWIDSKRILAFPFLLLISFADFSNTKKFCIYMETPVLQCWKTVLPNDRRNFFRDEDDRLLILILVASFIIISMIVIIGVVRFFSYCILSFYYHYLNYLHYWVGQLRSSLLWGRSLLFWCRVTGEKVKAVTSKLFNNVAHNERKWKAECKRNRFDVDISWTNFD